MIKLILMVFLLGLQNPPPSNGENSQPPQNQPSGEQSNPKVANASTNVPPVVTDLNSPARQEGSDATANQSGNKTPQDEWPNPAWVAIIVSAVSVLIGVGQFGMYYLQWQIMRKTLGQAARISRKQIKHATESSERGLRAYIGIVNAEDPNEKLFDNSNGYIFQIENTGQTPAYKVSCSSTWHYINGPAAEWPQNLSFQNADEIELNDPQRGSLVTLASGHKCRYRCALEDRKDGSKFRDIFALAMAKKATIFIYGTIRYEDVFKKRHYANFCVISAHFVAHKMHFSSYDRHNEAD